VSAVEGARAYFEQLAEFYNDPDCMAKEPPRPPSFEIAMEAAATCAQAIASILHYQQTGEVTFSPSQQAQLEAAGLISEQWPS